MIQLFSMLEQGLKKSGRGLAIIRMILLMKIIQEVLKWLRIMELEMIFIARARNRASMEK